MASIRKRQWKTNKGETRTAWTVDFVDANGTRSRQQFSSRKEADAFRITIEGKLRTGTFRPEADKITLTEAADIFLEYCARRRDRQERMSTHNYNTLEGHVRNYICRDPARHANRPPLTQVRAFDGSLSTIKLGQLTARRVGAFRDALRDAGVSVATTRKILATLQLLLNYAISQDLIAVNAAKDIKVIGRRDEGSKKILPPTKEAMKRLIAAAKPDFKVKLIFAATTGVRAGEMRALRWHHIDFEKGEVTIETRVDAYGDEDVTKTAAGMRTIPLAQPVILMLKEWKLRTSYKKPESLVFPSKRGTYMSHDNMIKRDFLPLFEVLAAKHVEDPEQHLPAPPRFNWHALRHYAVSTWIDADLSPKTVQTFAGHSSLQVTMDRYGHLFKSEDHKRAMEAIAGEIFRNA